VSGIKSLLDSITGDVHAANGDAPAALPIVPTLLAEGASAPPTAIPSLAPASTSSSTSAFTNLDGVKQFKVKKHSRGNQHEEQIYE
jgi:hypothetical protein